MTLSIIEIVYSHRILRLVLCSVDFQFSLVASLLLDPEPYIGNDHDEMFPLFYYKQVDRKLAPKLAVIFKHLVRGVIFPVCWRLTDVVSVPKDSSSSDVGDYRRIPIYACHAKGI